MVKVILHKPAHDARFPDPGVLEKKADMAMRTRGAHPPGGSLAVGGGPRGLLLAMGPGGGGAVGDGYSLSVVASIWGRELANGRFSPTPIPTPLSLKK